MARIRTIKPEFWTDERLTECSLSARLMFIGMWNFADDTGNMEASAKQLKMKIFPADDINTASLLDELLTHGLVIEYSVSGKKYLHIKGFLKHQVINRPSKSQTPPPGFTEDSVSAPEELQEGREGKGKEGISRPQRKAPRKNKSVLPEDFAPNETGTKKATDAGLNVERELSRFRDHHTAKGSTFLDWQAAWRTWIGNAIEFGRGKGQQANDDPYSLRTAV
jgi:hypothetical protein